MCGVMLARTVGLDRTLLIADTTSVVTGKYQCP